MDKKKNPEIIKIHTSTSPQTILNTLQQSSRVPVTEGKTVFVGCVPGNMREDEVIQELNLEGKIINFRLKQKQNKKGGMGFATFDIIDEELYKDYTIPGRKEIMLRGRKVPTRQYYSDSKKDSFLKGLNNKRVYLTNIPASLSDKEINATFSKFGNLLGAYAIRKKGVSQGFGYANYVEVRGAQNVIKRKRVPIWVNGNKFHIDCAQFKKGKDLKMEGGEEEITKNCQKNMVQVQHPYFTNILPPLDMPAENIQLSFLKKPTTQLNRLNVKMAQQSHFNGQNSTNFTSKKSQNFTRYSYRNYERKYEVSYSTEYEGTG